MLHNLKAEIARKNISRREVRTLLGISEKAFNNKLSGLNEFTFRQTLRIKNTYFPDLDLEYLFEDSKEARG